VEIGRALSGYTVVVTKSTVPVGTGRRVAALIREANPGAHFDMASNPEFLREGSAIEDFMRPDRVVIGAEGERARAAMAEAARMLPHVTWCDSAYEVAAGAHAAVLLTEWNEFRALDLPRLREAMQPAPVLVDLRNVYRGPEVVGAGMAYHGIGRPAFGAEG
jgi:UDP-glucose 6-dehydrogenase